MSRQYSFWQRERHEFSRSDLLIWPDDLAVSSAQIQKAYDWSITQWASFGNAILTAIFGLLASALVETYRMVQTHDPHRDIVFWVAVGVTVLVYLAVYAFCRWKILRLRQEFLALYTLLAIR